MVNLGEVVESRALTSTVYTLIRDRRYGQAIAILNALSVSSPPSRALLSLLAHCQYHSQDYSGAANSYFSLIEACPENPEYKLYYAQTLYKSGDVELAADILGSIERQTDQSRQLAATLRFECGDKSLISPDLKNDQKLVFEGFQFYRDRAFSKARGKFQEAAAFLGWRPFLAYNLAACEHQLGNFQAASAGAGEIISKAPRSLRGEFSGNSDALKISCLVEAANLQAAAQFKLQDCRAAEAAFAALPARPESELDAVTLHNSAVFLAGKNPAEAVNRLDHLLSAETKPKETVANFILIALRSGAFDLAGEALSPAAHLSPDLQDFSEAVVLCGAAPEEAVAKLTDLARKLEAQLGRAAAAIQDAKTAGPEEVRRRVAAYDALAGKLLPVVMWKAKVLWETRQIEKVDVLLRDYADFFADEDCWKINTAHVLFAQEKFPEAIQLYQPIVAAAPDLLELSALLLANLCVAHILTNQNEKAETLMHAVSLAEDKLDSPSFHLCTINIVIGNLYCSRGNYDFGISRLLKAFDPLERRLGAETWFYAKRALLSWLEQQAGQLIVSRDDTFAEVSVFLDSVIRRGKSVGGQKTAAQEARLLKVLLLKMR